MLTIPQINAQHTIAPPTGDSSCMKTPCESFVDTSGQNDACLSKIRHSKLLLDLKDSPPTASVGAVSAAVALPTTSCLVQAPSRLLSGSSEVYNQTRTNSQLFFKKKHRVSDGHGKKRRHPTRTWCSLVHVELAGDQNLQGLNQRIQTGLGPEQEEIRHRESQ